jgi:hypothetical protein
MAVKRRWDKRRAALTDDAIKWLVGSGASFYQFKDHEELVALWQTYGDESVAAWDMNENSNPVPLE